MTSPIDMLKQKQNEARQRLDEKGYFSDIKIYVGMATCEIAAGSVSVMEVFQQAVKSDKSLNNVFISQKGCIGRCNLEPTVEIYQNGKDPVKYIQVTPEKAQVIIDKHIKNGKIIQEWTGK